VQVGDPASALHSIRVMPDFLQLVRRDHDDLEAGLRELLRPSQGKRETATTLDGIRLGLTAHAEAEDIVLYRALVQAAPPAFVQQLVAEARRAHVEQETALQNLLSAIPTSLSWRLRAMQLLELVTRHSTHEEQAVVPALRDHVPFGAYKALAGEFATERLRQLALLQPSAVYSIEDARAAL